MIDLIKYLGWTAFVCLLLFTLGVMVGQESERIYLTKHPHDICSEVQP